MKIAFVTPRYLPYTGGVEAHAAALATRLVARGHIVEVYTQEPPSDLPTTESLDGVTVRRFPVALPPPAYALAPGLAVALYRARGEYDLTHVHSYHALAAVLGAAVAAGPIVCTPHFHGVAHRPLGRILHRPYRVLGSLPLRRSGAVICVSRSEAALLGAAFPWARSRIRVIPNGVDRAALEAAEPLPKEGPVLLAGGRLLPYKRIDRLIAAVSYLPAGWSLWITGDGPDAANLRAQAAALGVAHRMRLWGNVSRQELNRLLRTADAYASLSEAEAYGLGVAEAVVGGAGIVASPLAAHREVLYPSGPGIQFIGPDDAPPLVAAAVERAAAGRGRGPYPDIPDWEEITERTLLLYRQVLARRFAAR